MGTHGRPVMGSHRPGPMGPSIVLAPPPGWPDVAAVTAFREHQNTWYLRQNSPSLLDSRHLRWTVLGELRRQWR